MTAFVKSALTSIIKNASGERKVISMFTTPSRTGTRTSRIARLAVAMSPAREMSIVVTTSLMIPSEKLKALPGSSLTKLTVERAVFVTYVHVETSAKP